MVGGSSASFTGYVQAKRMRVLLVNEKEGLDYAPDAISIEKAGYTVETATVVIVTAPKGLPRPIAEWLEKAFVEATKMEPYVSVARKNETAKGNNRRGTNRHPLGLSDRTTRGAYSSLAQVRRGR
jgi:tripartite-type tricarboxylate transporter receptor subunit TctC